jgi:hypothetical protein
MAKAHRRAMEMQQHKMETIMKRRCTILDKVTFLEKINKIVDLERLMWT